MTQKHKTRGFTIIELLLAMTFISVLLLSIVMVGIQAGKMYNRGLVLSGLNQSWRDVSDTLRRDFLQTDQRRTVEGPAGFVHMLREGGSDRSGRFCLGQVSYLWNAPEVLDPDSGITHGPIVRDASGPINLVRVVDENAALCQELPTGGYIMELTDANGVSPGHITNLLKTGSGAGDVVLALHSVTLDKVTGVDNGPDGLFGVGMTIGTSKISEIDGQACRPPADAASNLEFCAINQFDMIVRTNG